MDRAGHENAGAGTAQRSGKGYAAGERLKGLPEFIAGNDSFRNALAVLDSLLRDQKISMEVRFPELVFTRPSHTYQLLLEVPGNAANNKEQAVIPLDYLVNHPEKVAAMVMSRLGANQKVFARNCTVERIEKRKTHEFLDRFHFMGSTFSAYNLGLLHHGELLGLASFSKGRKMRRLKETERSYEMIRFCTVPGYTVVGGLSRLVSAFCAARNAAEVMTYVDRQYSEGKAFSSAGFKVIETTAPKKFLVHRQTFVRRAWDGETFDDKTFYLTHNAGNLKMICSCR